MYVTQYPPPPSPIPNPKWKLFGQCERKTDIQSSRDNLYRWNCTLWLLYKSVYIPCICICLLFFVPAAPYRGLSIRRTSITNMIFIHRLYVDPLWLNTITQHPLAMYYQTHKPHTTTGYIIGLFWHFNHFSGLGDCADGHYPKVGHQHHDPATASHVSLRYHWLLLLWL